MGFCEACQSDRNSFSSADALKMAFLFAHPLLITLGHPVMFYVSWLSRMPLKLYFRFPMKHLHTFTILSVCVWL